MVFVNASAITEQSPSQSNDILTKNLPLLESPRVHLHVMGMLRFMSMTKTSRACPLLFILFLCLFLSLCPFQLYFIP